MKKGVLENFAKFIGKHLGKALLFNKVADLKPATILKKRLWHGCFPMSFAKFSRTPFLQNTSGRLLLSSDWIKSFSHSVSHKYSIKCSRKRYLIIMYMNNIRECVGYSTHISIVLIHIKVSSGFYFPLIIF